MSQNPSTFGPRLSRRHVLAGLATTPILGASLPALAQTPAAPVKVNIVNTSGTAGTTLQALMKRKGFLTQLGLDAEYQNIGDGSKLMGALLSGAGDISTMAGFAQVLTAIEKGANLKLVGGALMTSVHCLYSKKPEIKTIADLKGKTIGIGSPGALLHSLMVAILRKNNIADSEVTFVNVGSNVDVFRAIVAGVVDAGPSEVDFYYQQDKYGVHSLVGGELWKELPEFTFQAAFASDDAIAKRRDALVRTLAGYAKLYRYASSPESHDDFFAARAEALGKDEPKEAQTQWDFYRDNHSYSTDLVISEERVRYMQELNVLTGAQKAIIPYDKVVDMSLANDAIKMIS
jgi:ABC-type nitrate/sulfonate/bicarbonate transport system substrate-binding protein